MFKNKDVFIILTILAQSVSIVILNQVIYASDDLNYFKKFLPYVNLLILVLTAFVLISIRQIGDNMRKKVEANLLKSYLNQIGELMTTLQVQKHEHTRHIQTIQAMLYLDEVGSAKEYIGGVSEKYRYANEIIYVGNPVLTALLNGKRKVAESKSIDFDFAIKCNVSKIKIAPWDLSSILGNLLDNAFEAVIENNGNKKVGLEMKLEDNKLAIYVYNNGPKISSKEQRLLFKSGYTTKGSMARGYGLFLVKKLVDQYNGTVKIGSEKRTVFIIYFPIEEVLEND
ncbi:Sensor_kinase_SpoOB-type, alpha-helical domain [Anaerovirgula multivorans]|uniref:Sensor_kinase_SpoOB-type, alpha-helical domain n=1 Tax=Anaerovirgula multivorans TaxID=312168 RepID=A0A239FKA1_9FIRM|nr:ATP-binding protein [Anaerovirgula multivorans]SNS57255.1 Sensor_kinase_SpoOB-type, alpha-helical domain [Anaerovirgula multivorans]